jgi:hypothetical protein
MIDDTETILLHWQGILFANARFFVPNLNGIVTSKAYHTHTDRFVDLLKYKLINELTIYYSLYTKLPNYRLVYQLL